MATIAADGRTANRLLAAIIAIAGAGGLGAVGLHRGGTLNALWIVVAAICVCLSA